MAYSRAIVQRAEARLQSEKEQNEQILPRPHRGDLRKRAAPGRN